MHDTYLILTPFLMLIVVGLVGFVGCDQVFGLTRVDIDYPPLNLRATTGTMRVDLMWDPPEQGDVESYKVARGRMSHNYTIYSEDPILAPTMSYTDTNVQDGMTYYYAVSAILTNGNETPLSAELPVTAGLMGIATLLTPTHLGNPRNDFSGFAGVGILVGASPVEIKNLGRIKIAGNSQMHNIRIINGDSPTKDDVSNGGVNVDLTMGTDGEFVYAPLLSPVLLMPNTNYYIISQEISGGDQYYNADVTTVSAVAEIASVYPVYSGDGVSFNAAPGSVGAAYIPVNAQYAV